MVVSTQYQLSIVPSETEQRVLQTLVQTTYPPESLLALYPPVVTIFRPLTKDELEDIAFLLTGWGPFTMNILRTFQVQRTSDGDGLVFPVESQDCIYMSHILSRFLDDVPTYATSYLPFCHVGMVQRGYGQGLSTQIYSPLPIFVRELTLIDTRSSQPLSTLSLTVEGN